MIARIWGHLWQVGGGGVSHPSDAAIYLVRLGSKAAHIATRTGLDHLQLRRNVSESLEQGVQSTTFCPYTVISIMLVAPGL